MKINKFTFFTLFLLSVGLITAQTIQVKVSDGLNTALDFTNQGSANIIELVDDGGIYYTTPATISSPVTIKAASGLTNPPVIVMKSCKATPFFKILDNLTLDGVILDGLDPATAVYDSIQHVLSVQAKAGATNEKPDVKVLNSVIRNIYKFADPSTSVDGDIFDISTGARAGDLVFENTTFMNTGDEAIRSINTHKSPVPVDGNFCNTMIVRNCTFHNIQGSCIKIEGDGDSTNVDSPVFIEHCTFNKTQIRVIWHRDLQYTIIRDLLITNMMQGNDQLDNNITFQGNGSTVAFVDTFNASVPNHASGFLPETPASWSGAKLTGTVDASTIYNLDPKYKDAANADFTLAADSPVLTLASDGKALGDLRWSPNATAVEDENAIPTEFSLEQNYPNPFNPTTNIQFSIPESGNYSIKVYNLLGQEVANLIDSQLNAGFHTVSFNASKLASGLYVYRLTGNNVSIAKKMLLMK